MKNEGFDFWYAVNNTEIVLMPMKQLETFGATMLNYHMLSELMDSVNQVRIREGRVQASQPQVVVPAEYAQNMIEGFGEEAQQYIEWLRKHEKYLRILQYGFTIKKQEINEHIVTENLKTVVERVKHEVQHKNDPLDAVVVGVDKPWEICLLKLLIEVSERSFPGNIRELDQRRMFQDERGVPRAVRVEIENDFNAAASNPKLLGNLNAKLRRYGLFEEYEDRFFTLVRRHGAQR